MGTTGGVALELAGVTRQYGGRRALDGVSLAIPAGAAVGLLGPNGAGKTTIVRVALGLVMPSAGSVLLRGHDPFDPRAREKVGWVPERSALPARMTVLDFLRLHGELAGLRGADLERAIDGRLAETGLADRVTDRLGALSKGLAQRVSFAQALLADPELVLLDEPTSGLDPLGIREARGWIAAARARGATLVVSSHVLTEIERLCDHVVILHEGRITASGPLADVLGDGESLEDAYVRIIRGTPALAR